mmetsp:Transcript_15891/g.31982  ORF Transcript_15891/g.31982 Transcript_15891/m.31982 type:complete len:89 (+) Transcript_15891:73-339(+)
MILQIPLLVGKNIAGSIGFSERKEKISITWHTGQQHQRKQDRFQQLSTMQLTGNHDRFHAQEWQHPASFRRSLAADTVLLQEQRPTSQ